jgi:hypothetical protein
MQRSLKNSPLPPDLPGRQDILEGRQEQARVTARTEVTEQAKVTEQTNGPGSAIGS